MQLNVVDSPQGRLVIDDVRDQHNLQQKNLKTEKKLKKFLSVENMYKLNWGIFFTKPQAKLNHTYVKSGAAKSTLRKNKN